MKGVVKGDELGADLEKSAVKDILGLIGKMWILFEEKHLLSWKSGNYWLKKKQLKTEYAYKQYENIFVNKRHVNI